MPRQEQLTEAQKRVLAETCAIFAEKYRIPVSELLEFIAALLILMAAVGELES